MSTESKVPENDPNLSGLGRALLGTNEGSKPSGPWVPPTAEELHQILPQYEIVKMLGRGGMGAVYMGKQTALDRPVAIKILSAQLEESDMGFTERFKNEARAMGKLNHPSIVSVYEFGQHESGLLYIVMEYVDGTDVAKMIAKSGRLHTEHAMAITAHVCDALAYAHERGIIHRDIKPANIMVDYDGSVKVADFGLAKVSTSNGSTLGLTQSGMAMGTLHFMAPEALMLGTAVDHRADIYAVGVMLYQMLTGKLPQGMFKLPSLQIPGLDPRYDRIIAKAMMEDRETRYQSARDMRADLDGILTQPVVKADPEAPKAPQAALPTAARPQRPGGKPVMRPASAPSMPQPAARGSQSWLWVAALGLLALGGAAWWLIQPKSQTALPAAAEELASHKANAAQSSVASSTTANPAEATKERPFVNSLGMKFVPVPGTNALFCIHETRYKDYAAYASGTPGLNKDWEDQSADGYTPSSNLEDHPVMKVSWEDAQRFCDWLSKKDGQTYRLPTDREWSMAVGIGGEENWSIGTTPATVQKNPSRFVWGSQWPPPQNAGNFSDESRKAKIGGTDIEIAGYDDGYPTTAPVMRFAANDLGLHDLGGNVWEWCEDWFDQAHTARVLRGGCYFGGERDPLLASHRSARPQTHGSRYIGFRVVLDTAGQTRPITGSETATDPAEATKERPFVNSLGMKFVPVPGTNVLFCIHETRYKDYAAYASGTHGLKEDWKDQSADGFTPSGNLEEHPVMKVSWNDAREFCAWLGKKENRAYSLPTDEQWSVAIGLGDLEKHVKGVTPKMLSQKHADVFAWGQGWPPPPNSGNVSDQSRKTHAPGTTELFYLDGYDDRHPTTAPVMSYPPNEFGLHDLWGNVWEWCEDAYDETATERVLRGFGWKSGGRTPLMSSFRFHRPPTSQYGIDAGFRVVLVLEPSAPVAIQPSGNQEPQSGWPPLFNGKDLTGWEGNPRNFPAKVIDGQLKIEGVAMREDAGHLFYVGDGSLAGKLPEWKNFELTTTLKTLRMGNSGLRIHSRPASREFNINATGPEINIWNEGMTTPVDKDHRTGGIPRMAVVPVSYFKDGEWFEMKIRVENDTHLQVWVRREGAVTWTTTVDWTQPANWTPPPYHPHARLSSGTIAFTNWVPAEGELWVRDVKIRSLDESTAPVASPGATEIATFNGHRYQFVPGALTWKEAKAKAESMSGHLATITSKEENEWLLLTYRKLLTTQNRNIWLGAIEEMAGLGWKWVTGEPFTPLGWFPGEPNGKRGGGGQVGHPFMLNLYSFKDGAVGWNDSSTHFSQSRDNIGFIVEWDADTPVAAVASASTWIDAKGRVIQARFISLSGDTLVLEAAGKKYPLSLAALSADSQQIARDLAAGDPSSKAAPLSDTAWLEGRWLQVNPQKGGEIGGIVDYLPGGVAMFMNGHIDGIGAWQTQGGAVTVQWPGGGTNVHKLMPSADSKILAGEVRQKSGSHFSVQETQMAAVEHAGAPVKEDLEGKVFDFGWFVDGDSSKSALRLSAALHFLPGGVFQGKTNANETRWEIKDGKLMFFHANGSRTTTFQQFYRLGGAWTLIGPFHGKPGITHVIRERVPVPDRAISASSNWSTFFPNDSLSGWSGDTTAYRVSGGVLTGSGRGDLISPKEYGNFELKFDLRISAEANSGIGIWRDAVTGTTAGASHGFEVQIQDDTAPKYSRQEFWQRHAGIYYFKPPLNLAMNPPGSWNTHEIRMEGTQVKVTINGKLVQDADVTQLKPQTGRAPVLDVSRRRGHLVILGRNGVVELRNMQIKELP